MRAPLDWLKPGLGERRLKGLETLVSQTRALRVKEPQTGRTCYDYRPFLLVWAGRGVVYAFGWTATYISTYIE